MAERVPVCSICLNPPDLRFPLACGHLFCFLHLKEWAMKHPTCPICRAPIDLKTLHTPNCQISHFVTLPKNHDFPGTTDELIKTIEEQEEEEDIKPDLELLRLSVAGQQNGQIAGSSGGRDGVSIGENSVGRIAVGGDAAGVQVPRARLQPYMWLYQCKYAGWWRFDPVYEVPLEEAYNSNQPSIVLKILATDYKMDLRNWIQYPIAEATKIRGITRVSREVFSRMVAEKQVIGISGILVEKEWTLE